MLPAAAAATRQRTSNEGSQIGARLVFRLIGVMTTWRYDRRGNVIPLNVTFHLYKPVFQTSRGFENPIFIDRPP